MVHQKDAKAVGRLRVDGCRDCAAIAAGQGSVLAAP